MAFNDIPKRVFEGLKQKMPGSQARFDANLVGPPKPELAGPPKPGLGAKLSSAAPMLKTGLGAATGVGYAVDAARSAANGDAGNAIGSGVIANAQLVPPVGIPLAIADGLSRGITGGGIVDNIGKGVAKVFGPAEMDIKGPTLKDMESRGFDGKTGLWAPGTPGILPDNGKLKGSFPGVQADAPAAAPRTIVPQRSGRGLNDGVNFSGGLAGLVGGIQTMASNAAGMRQERGDQKLAMDQRKQEGDELYQQGTLANQRAANENAAGLRRDAQILAQRKLEDDNLEKGDTVLQKRMDGMFTMAGADKDGKPTFVKNEAEIESFKNFMAQKDPRFKDLTGPARDRMLAEVITRGGDKFLSDARTEYEMSKTMNARQKNALFGGGTQNAPDPIINKREATLSDVANGGLGVKDYVWSNLPFTDRNVVAGLSGRVALNSDMTRGADGETSTDRERVIMEQLADARKKGLKERN